MDPREIIQIQMKLNILLHKIRDYSSIEDGYKNRDCFEFELAKCQQEYEELSEELERKKQRASSLYWQTRFMNVL